MTKAQRRLSDDRIHDKGINARPLSLPAVFATNLGDAKRVPPSGDALAVRMASFKVVFPAIPPTRVPGQQLYQPPLSRAIRGPFSPSPSMHAAALVPAPSLSGWPREQWCVFVGRPVTSPGRQAILGEVRCRRRARGPQARTPHLAAKTGQGVRRASSPTTLLLLPFHNAAAHQLTLTSHCTGDQDALTPPGTQRYLALPKAPLYKIGAPRSIMFFSGPQT